MNYLTITGQEPDEAYVDFMIVLYAAIWEFWHRQVGYALRPHTVELMQQMIEN